jgi:hypothetical protein
VLKPSKSQEAALKSSYVPFAESESGIVIGISSKSSRLTVSPAEDKYAPPSLSPSRLID